MIIFKNLKLIICILIYCLPQQAFSARLFAEKTYQDYWCKKCGGTTEYKLQDNTRVDCVIDDYAIEFDFANKWSESIGQSLYYSHCLNKKAGVVLIMENIEKDTKYLNRLLKVANLHNITVWTITPNELALSTKDYQHTFITKN